MVGGSRQIQRRFGISSRIVVLLVRLILVLSFRRSDLQVGRGMIIEPGLQALKLQGLKPTDA